jgi:hypothetical protein
MKNVLRVMIAAGALSVTTMVFAQSTNTATPSTGAPRAPAAQDGSSPAASAATGKRSACQSAAQGATGQERKDQMQLCMAQAHLDCVKQAIDQKIVGPQRRDFVKSCMGGGG